MFFHEKSHSRQGIWSFRSEKVSFFDTIFALRPEGFRHASNWQGPGAAIRASFFFATPPGRY